MSADNAIIFLYDENEQHIAHVGMSSWLDVEHDTDLRLKYLKQLNSYKKFNNIIDAKKYTYDLLDDLPYVEYGIIQLKM